MKNIRELVKSMVVMEEKQGYFQVFEPSLGMLIININIQSERISAFIENTSKKVALNGNEPLNNFRWLTREEYMDMYNVHYSCIRSQAKAEEAEALCKRMFGEAE